MVPAPAHRNRNRSRTAAYRLAGGAAWIALLGVWACSGPKYPSCDNDDECNVKVDDKEHHGVCVNHTCVECRDDKACGAGRECKAGACAAIDGFCDDTHACPDGQTCSDNRCHAPQKVASTPPPSVECDDTHPCSGTNPRQRCENGHCISPPKGGPGCMDFPSPHFDYESPELRVDAKQVLQRLAGCLTTGTLKTGQVLLTGHCDNRGEMEFNMSLGADRAEAVRTFLVGLGVGADRVKTSSRGELDAVGTDEAGWSTDRRVDIEIR
jgi:peptidoglycan-associated lipoprotein